MPSFLSKVFGRKKDDKNFPQSKGRVSDGSLLDGKFEAVSPIVSPSVADFLETANGKGNRKEKEKDKERPFGLFRVKSAPSSPSSPHKKDDLPQLSLVLPVPKDDAQARALGVVFEADPDAQILTDVAIGDRRLNPLEALILVRICSQAITTRGLETLGLMRPHWYSASPDVQRRLISLFIHSLNTKSPVATLSPTPSSSTSVFETEVTYTRSPHDVAAVLRWGLRHLELSGNSFGKEDSWYKAFSEAERNSEYPPKAYSEKLGVLVPASHLELLNATLELFSSLAAHAEKNSTSGSKLTRAFGLWLLSTQRVEDGDDWSKFYARWEQAGRMLGHLFLSRIRDEALGIRMPTRLLELVAQYPYSKGATAEDDVFLHPRLSTRQHDALFVRVESEVSSPDDRIKRHPLQLIRDAFGSETTSDKADCAEMWEKIRKASAEEHEISQGDHPALSHVFTDETVRYLTLIPGDHLLKEATSPTFSVTEAPQEMSTSRRQSSTPAERAKPLNGTSNGHMKPATDPSPLPSSPTSPIDTDWVQFSSAGFSGLSPSVAPLASTLFGQDVEKTNPPSRKPSRRARASRSPSANPSRKSLDAPRAAVIEALPKPKPEPPKLVSKSIPTSLVRLDEAFVEFWTDALLDPISSNWPTFVLCKLKSSVLDLKVGEKSVEYLIIEQAFVPKPQPPAPVEVENAQVTTSEKLRPSSPKSSKSEKRFFGFFTSSSRGRLSPSVDKISATTGKGRKKFPPQAKVSELGEVLKEEEDKKPSTTVKLRIPSPKPRASADVSRKSADVGRKSADVPRKSADVPKELVKDPTKGVEETEPVGVNAGESVAVAAAKGRESEPIITGAALAPGGDVLETAEPTQAVAAAPEEVGQVVQEQEPAIAPALAPEGPEQPTPVVIENVTVAPTVEEPVEPEEPHAAAEPIVAADLAIAPEQPSVPTVDTTSTAPDEHLIVEPPVEEPIPEEPSMEEPIAQVSAVEELDTEPPAVEEPGAEPVEETVTEPSAVVEPTVTEELADEPVIEDSGTGAVAIEESNIEGSSVAPTSAQEPISGTPVVERRPLTEEPTVEEPAVDVAPTLAVETIEPLAEEQGAEEPAVDQSTTLAEEAPAVSVEEEMPASGDQDPVDTAEEAPNVESVAFADEEPAEAEPPPVGAAGADTSTALEPPVEPPTGPAPEAALAEPEQEDEVEVPSHAEEPLSRGATENVADSSTSFAPETETISVEPPVENAEPESAGTPAETPAVDETGAAQESSAPTAKQTEEVPVEPGHSLNIISSTPRIEPLSVEEDTANGTVSQDPIPVVEAPPPAINDAEHVTVPLVEDTAEESTPTTAEPESTIQPPTNVTALGSTPGPQVALDATEAPADDDESRPAPTQETANGNGYHATAIDKDTFGDDSIPAATSQEPLSVEDESTTLADTPTPQAENPDPELNTTLDRPSEAEAT